MDEDVITCQRKVDGEPCGEQIPLVKENIVMLRPEVPLLNVVCPKCHQSKILPKDKSKELAELYFKEEYLEAKEEAESEQSMPSVGFGNKVKETLEMLGYKGKKWSDKVSAITEFARTTPIYQNPDGLYRLLAAWGIDVQHIPLVIQKVFGAADVMAQQGYNMMGMPGFGYSGPTNTGFAMGPQQNMGGYTMQQTPTGQIILIPPQPNPVNPAPATHIIPRGDNEDVVIEELDDEGKVKKRITKGRARRGSDEDAEDSTMKTLKMMKELGLIQPPQPRTETQTARIPDELEETLNQLGDAVAALAAANRDVTGSKDNEEITKLTNTVENLRDQVSNYEREKKEDEIKGLRSDISELKGTIANLQPGRSHNETPSNLTDAQFETHTKHRSLETITESGEHFVDKVTDPLNKILEGQQKLNSLIMVRDMEKTDGVPPGTYMKALQPTPSYSDMEVKSTVSKWKDKAANTPVAKKEGVAA